VSVNNQKQMFLRKLLKQYKYLVFCSLYGIMLM